MSITLPITPKENLKRFIKGEHLWMPQYKDNKMFSPSMYVENVCRGFVMETDKYTGEFGGPDQFGVEWEFVPTVGGSMVRPGSPKVPDLAEWEKYVIWPDLSKLDWAGVAEKNKEFLTTDKVLMQMNFTSFFERLISFVDMENALIAMIDPDEQEDVHRLFDRLADYYDELFGYIEKYFHTDLIYFHDDWGSQRAPMFSLDTVREMLVPYIKRCVDSAHKHGMVFELHSCGKIQDLVPAMIEAGVDMWCGQDMNDKLYCAREYGDYIHIGVAPKTFPEGTPEEEQIAEIDRILDEYPDTIYIGRHLNPGDAMYNRVVERTLKK
ncbi:MAG: methyltransferase [Lachnospiraceae bacterium]|nr:methyltransferase [Lachnospiraceae bacterium]